MRNFLALTAFVATATLAAVAPAMAGTTNGTINVGATTLASCTAPSAVAIALGNYDGTALVTGTTNVVFKCTNTSTGTVTLLSASATGTATGGTLSGGTTTPIAYTFTGNNTVSPQGNGLAGAAADISVPVTATIAAGENPIPSLTYADIINVTVTY
jgi:spore coat protein U-like protein